MKVSVIMSVYNAQQQALQQAIRSVTSQSYTAFDFYICNDGSTNDTAQWLQEEAAKDARIHILTNDTNQGLAASLNRCIQQAPGNFLIRQDADDLSLPGRFSSLCQAAGEHPEIDLFSSNIHLFNEDGVWGIRNYPMFPQKEDFLFCVPFQHGAVAYRKEAVCRVGGYRVLKKTRRTEDLDLFARMYLAGSRGMTLPTVYYAYREDAAAQCRRKYRYRIDEANIKFHAFKELGLFPKGIPYAIKPLIVGLIPNPLLNKLKQWYYHLNLE